MPSQIFRILCLFSSLAITFPVAAATFYVDGAKGSNTASGATSAAALKTLQRACDLVKAGDTVVVASGVYLEHVELQTLGTAEKPITFKADKIEKSRVVVSGAVPAIRNQEVKWQLDDEKLLTYSIPLDYSPARVLYDNVDLSFYPTLASLQEFRYPNQRPGVRAGYAQENGRLYVRLRADGKYGPSDPSRHIMAVAGSPVGGGFDGLNVVKPQDYIWGVGANKPTNPAYVVFDGFTFETPGTAAIYLPGGYVTVRNCWFFGCRAGASGWGNGSNPAEKSTKSVVIEYCDITQFPTFDDMKDVMQEHRDDPVRGDKKDFHQRLYWWQRKDALGSPHTYETGIAVRIGTDWIIRNNNMHDGVEYLSSRATAWSRNLQVYDNRFERLVDNAIEAEDHAVNLRFFNNFIVDVFEPFSWQPLGGLPWPGPIYFYKNVIWTSPENIGVWRKEDWMPGMWKLGAQEDNWTAKWIQPPLASDEVVHPPGEGFLSFNNTIYCPDHDALTRVQKWTRPYENFHIFNNLVVLNDFNPNETKYLGEGIDFSSNVVALVDPKNEAATTAFTANGGKLLRGLSAAGMVDPEHQHFELTEASLARGVRAADSPPEALPDAGAVPYGKTWKPPVVGPRTEAETSGTASSN